MLGLFVYHLAGNGKMDGEHFRWLFQIYNYFNISANKASVTNAKITFKSINMQDGELWVYLIPLTWKDFINLLLLRLSNYTQKPTSSLNFLFWNILINIILKAFSVDMVVGNRILLEKTKLICCRNQRRFKAAAGRR